MSNHHPRTSGRAGIGCVVAGLRGYGSAAGVLPVEPSRVVIYRFRASASSAAGTGRLCQARFGRPSCAA